jgi:hypothetical protein
LGIRGALVVAAVVLVSTALPAAVGARSFGTSREDRGWDRWDGIRLELDERSRARGVGRGAWLRHAATRDFDWKDDVGRGHHTTREDREGDEHGSPHLSRELSWHSDPAGWTADGPTRGDAVLPEPGAGALLAAGLLLVTRLGRRR